MAWHIAYQRVKPFLFRIITENGFGTGFLYAFNQDHSIAAVATAAHVIEHDHAWSKPIKMGYYETRDVVLFSVDERVVWLDSKRDAATILIPSTSFTVPASALPIMDPTKYKKVGVEVGWVGFPAICPHELCFFSGKVSAFLEDENCYLIDGVAINGVSGGPVFVELKDSTPEIVGIVSAYMANRAAQETLPGLLMAHDVTSHQEHIQRIKSFDDAKEKEKETQKEIDNQKKPDSCEQPAAQDRQEKAPAAQ